MAYGNPVKFTGFEPDSDPMKPGVLLDVDGWMPTERGMRTMPSFVLVATATLPAPSMGAITATLPDGTHVIIAGTAQHLYQLQGDAWVEFDSGQTFTGTERWTFTVFNTDILAVNGTDFQISRSGLPFVDITNYSIGTPPQLIYVEAVGQGVFGVSPNSNSWVFVNPFFTLGFLYNWNPDIATETVYGQLTATAGPITSLHAIRGGIVMYKQRSIYFGQFGGPPFFWTFTLISKNVGTPANECVVNALDMHLFPASDNFYQFDGSSLSPIPNSLAESFFRDTPVAQIARMLGRYTQRTSLAQWFYNPGDRIADLTLPLNTALLYNTRVGKWSKRTLYDSDGNQIGIDDVISPAFISGPAVTYTEIGDTYNTYNDIPDISYAELGGISEEVLTTAIITADGVLATETGPSVGGFLLTGEIGNGNEFVQANRARPVFASWPVDRWSRLKSYFRLSDGFPIPDPNILPLPGIGPAADLTLDGAYNLIVTGRSLQFRLEVSSQTEITGMALDATFAGTD